MAVISGICAGVVLYNPEISRLKENIDAYITDVEMVYFFDNASSNICEIETLLLEYGSKVHLIKYSKNMGIAFALNRIMEKAKLDGMQWVLTMDQDSVCQAGMLSEFAKHIFIKDVGIICPFILMRGGTRKDYEGRPLTEYIDQCITSASLTRIEAWEKSGGFDEYLFIDFVDMQINACMKKIGYKILRCNNVFLLQEFASESNEIIIFGHHIYNYNYPEMRLYYRGRNAVYCSYKYDWFFTSKYVNHFFLVTILKIILFQKNKLKKMMAISRGKKDGWKKIRECKEAD